MSGHAEPGETGATERLERGKTGYSRPPERGDTDVIGARIGAQLIDSAVMAVLLGLSLIFFGSLASVAGNEAGGVGVMLGLFLGMTLAMGYGFILEGFWDGHTVGKQVFGIKVVEEDGAECSLGSAFVRNLLEFIDGLFYYLVGFIVMAASDRRQRLGDRLAGTVVVREE